MGGSPSEAALFRVSSRRSFAPLVAVMVVAWTLASGAAQAARAVILVRHAEKASEPKEDPALTIAGEDRAIALTRFLRRDKIDAIFTSEMRRTKDTAAILARQKNVTPVVVPANDVKGLVAKIQALPADAVVVVVGHSNTVPEIVAALGVQEKVTIGDDEFQRVFVVTPTAAGKPSLLEFAY